MQAPNLDSLSPREREVLILIAEGKSLMQIAQTLHRSLKTVESHRLSLGRKLSVSNRVELARIAIANGLVTLTTTPQGEQAAASSGADASAEQDPLAERWEDAISDRLSDRAGPDYINELACALCDIVDVAHAGICIPDEEEDGRRVFRSLACSVKGQIADQYSYDITNTPCHHALEQGECHVLEAAAQRFNQDPFLAEVNAESYAGVRLRNRQGEAVGVLWLVDTKPIEHAEPVRQLLLRFAPRAAAVVTEIHRTRQALRLCEQRGEQLRVANLELRKKNQQLDQIAEYYSGLAERMSDGLVVLDEKRHIEFANEKFAQIAGLSRKQLLGRLADDLLTPDSREVFVKMQPQRESDEMEHYECAIQRPDGGVRKVVISPRALLDDQQQYSGSFGVVTDLADIQDAREKSTGGN